MFGADESAKISNARVVSIDSSRSVIGLVGSFGTCCRDTAASRSAQGRPVSGSRTKLVDRPSLKPFPVQ